MFDATINGQTYEIDGVTNIGASASTGRHTVTWTPPTNLVVKASDCTMTATLLTADKPSGDDYLVVDIQTGKVWYEGLLASQDLSNERYNTVLYKTTNMVFRKIAKTCDSGLDYYRTGTATNVAVISCKENTGAKTYMITNSLASRVVYKDYYVGVFPVTQWQYNEIYGSNPSWFYEDYVENGEVVDDHWYRPVDNMQWNHGRQPLNPTQPVTISASGSFLGKLNYRTQNGAGVTGFDYPTKMMLEIAVRGGVNTRYPWGADKFNDVTARRYAVSSSQKASDMTTRTNGTRRVGSKLPNNIGIYDGIGNVRCWLLDCGGASAGDLATKVTDIFTPLWFGVESADRMSTYQSCSRFYSTNADNIDPSAMYLKQYNSTYREWGMRVAFIPE